MDAASLTYYSFGAPNPVGGFCETQIIGPQLGVAEPLNAAFALTTVIIGVAAVYRSKRTTMAYQFLYGLLAAYGAAAFVYHLTLDNGWYRIMDVEISYSQALILALLVHALYQAHEKSSAETRTFYRILSATMTLVFTMYPAVVHVAGESVASPYVAWLVFDLLWFVMIAFVVLIWRRRKSWPDTPYDVAAFRLIPYALGACGIAYGCWVLDKFACAPWVAYAQLHGLWHLFMGLCFYYLITMCRYLAAQEYGYKPHLVGALGLPTWLLPFVKWEPIEDKSEVGG